MEGFKLKKSKILRKILSNDNIYGENKHQHLSEAGLHSSRLSQTSYESKRSLKHHHDKTKIFVGSWNVGGIAPPKNLDMGDWLDTQNNSADIFVLGFQEIVPLNAANVLGPQNRKASMKWNSLIEAALNKRRPRKLVQDNRITESQKVYPTKEHDCVGDERGKDFMCITSRQLVGMFMTVWIQNDLYPHISNLNISAVGCGIMGYMGNKGSISIRLCLHETSFCFVCSHLASGGTEVDRRQRNANAIDILSQTSFPAGQQQNFPQTILDHDRVIWLGDLNYKICLPYCATRSLVKRKEWTTLLKNDQLKMELTEGNVFEGWQEGDIEFPPTYKYHPNSEDYIGCDQPHKNKKRRAPAWCDRIIWFGQGMKQINYERSESRLSDHRPVRAMFIADIKIVGSSR